VPRDDAGAASSDDMDAEGGSPSLRAMGSNVPRSIPRVSRVTDGETTASVAPAPPWPLGKPGVGTGARLASCGMSDSSEADDVVASGADVSSSDGGGGGGGGGGGCGGGRCEPKCGVEPEFLGIIGEIPAFDDRPTSPLPLLSDAELSMDVMEV
jgi:hypothetical protein